MGEIADMMIEGAMCETCGEFLGDEVGYPRQCYACSSESAGKSHDKVNCPICGKRVKRVGLAQHTRDVHGDTPR